ncbi:alkaline phosphatase family protein [Paenibacillus hexagrammi]|uniref:Sulfatase N-terminal domain-containing protein n=1 Tax=Paenibacillus hexagrammi TaxID=2908839 RepID=A0ABY3SI75_9BACL|nr:hypothetical protein [Paenibacillus sp. YPD9-1]UJF33215.1 hypothetical protein L0M14_27390 [Paenibacillus sp. YPD9-1]
MKMLQDQGYDLNIFANPTEKKLGLLPPGFEIIGHHNSDLNLERYAQNLRITDQSFTFISLPDFHWAQDDYGYNKDAVRLGYDRVLDSLHIIDNHLSVEQFDWFFIFSDHGFKLTGQSQAESYLQLNADRTNTFMLMKSKQDKELSLNDELRSIMDIYPTICELLDVTSLQLDGLSLLQEQEHPLIVVEDFTSFYPQINQQADLWAVIKKQGVYYRTLEQHFFENADTFTETAEELDQIIADTSSLFGEYLKERIVFQHYKELNEDNQRVQYTSGKLRYSLEKFQRDFHGKKVIAFGTGLYAQEQLNQFPYPIDYFVDNNAQRWGETFFGETYI